MASKFTILQQGIEIKRGIRFNFGGDFNYSVIIDCALDGVWKNGFFTWSGAGPGLSGEAQVFDGESSFELRGTYQNVDDLSVTGNFTFSPVSGTIPSNGFIDVNVTPAGVVESKKYFYVELNNNLETPGMSVGDITCSVLTNKTTYLLDLGRSDAGAGVGDGFNIDLDETVTSVTLKFTKGVSAVQVVLVDNCSGRSSRYSKDTTSFTTSTSSFCSGIINGKQCDYASWTIYDE